MSGILSEKEVKKATLRMLQTLMEDIESEKVTYYGHEYKSDFEIDQEKSMYGMIVTKPNGVKHLTLTYRLNKDT